jgi:hypothetical protein
MKVYERKSLSMKLDMDLVRDLLLHVENDPQLNGKHWIRPDTVEEIGAAGHSIDEVEYHLIMLIENGFIKGSMTMEGMPAINRLTWAGHELLDDIRDPSIWSQTKERLKGLSGVGFSVIGEIARAEIKKHLGLP